MLIQVPYRDLVTTDRLEYPLYLADGEQLHEAGEALQLADMARLKTLTVYRDTDFVPFDHEGRTLQVPAAPLSPVERWEVRNEDTQPDIYPNSGDYLRAIRAFWDGMEAGETPNIALCKVIRDQLVADVTSHADQVLYLSQLRVRDAYTFSHTLNVSALSIALALKVGLGKEEVAEIGLASILHDLGKYLIPKSIMFKPTRLTEKEFEVMKLHPGLGYKMIKEQLKLPEHIARPALEHQEMWAGGGYPLDLKGEEIHPYSQIVKIADVYEALTARRPYKDAIPHSRAIQIMLGEGAKSFNPALLAQFIDMGHYADPAAEGLAS